MAQNYPEEVQFVLAYLQHTTQLDQSFARQSTAKLLDSLSTRQTLYGLYQQMLLHLVRTGYTLEPYLEDFRQAYTELIKAVHNAHATHQEPPYTEVPR
jgi:hypothetical protein